MFFATLGYINGFEFISADTPFSACASFHAHNDRDSVPVNPNGAFPPSGAIEGSINDQRSLFFSKRGPLQRRLGGIDGNLHFSLLDPDGFTARAQKGRYQQTYQTSRDGNECRGIPQEAGERQAWIPLWASLRAIYFRCASIRTPRNIWGLSLMRSALPLAVESPRYVTSRVMIWGCGGL